MLSQVQREFADQRLTVVAVNIAPQANKLEEYRDYMQEYGAGDLVWAQDTDDNSAVRAFNIRGLGTTIVVDRNGRIIYRDVGPTAYDTLRPEVVKALG